MTKRPGLAFAVLAGAGAVAMGGSTRALVDAPSCAGLPALATFALARIAPTIPVSLWMSWIDPVILFFGIVLSTRLAQRVSGSALAGTASGAALAAWTVDSPPFALLYAAGPLVTAIAFEQLGAREPRPYRLCLSLALVASMWPPMALACAAAFLIASRPLKRFETSVLAGVSVIVGLAAVTLRVSSTAGSPVTTLACLMPDDIPGSLGRASAAMSTIGPYVCAAAVLGLFVRRRDLRVVPTMAAGLLMACAFMVTPGPGASMAGVAVTLAAAIGLDEAVRACRPGPGGILAAALLTSLLPVLAWQSTLTAPRPRERAERFGHNGVSLSLVRGLLSDLPTPSRVVLEDATTDVLVRAARPGASTSALPRDTTQIATALAGGVPVFALPHAQHELEQLGYRLTDRGNGIAAVTAGAECQVATNQWRPLTEIDATPTFALVARTPAEAGPVVIYASFDTRPALVAVDWPAAATRGFYTTVYARDSANDRAQLARDVSDDSAPADQVGSGRPFVARLELWRTPSAPMRLTVALGSQPHDAIARVIAKSEPRHLLICPTFPHVVQPLAP